MDNNADAVIDIACRIRFSTMKNNSQTASVQLATGRNVAANIDAGETIIKDVPVTFGTGPKSLRVVNSDFLPDSEVIYFSQILKVCK